MRCSSLEKDALAGRPVTSSFVRRCFSVLVPSEEDKLSLTSRGIDGEIEEEFVRGINGGEKESEPPPLPRGSWTFFRAPLPAEEAPGGSGKLKKFGPEAAAGDRFDLDDHDNPAFAFGLDRALLPPPPLAFWLRAAGVDRGRAACGKPSFESVPAGWRPARGKLSPPPPAPPVRVASKRAPPPLLLSDEEGRVQVVALRLPPPDRGAAEDEEAERVSLLSDDDDGLGAEVPGEVEK